MKRAFSGMTRDLTMVSNRLPVDRITASDGSSSWQTAPGGLVSAVKPIVEQLGCRWIGWAGTQDEDIDPFKIGTMQLHPVGIDGTDIRNFYEGFSNGTLWPLYHDVIARPQYRREWWETYRDVNRRFAEQAAHAAPMNSIVWVHDYHLQLVPAMLRERRPDLTIGFYLHIPFPPRSLFAQLPWRRRIIDGILGADVVGFQRVADANSFRHSAELDGRAHLLGNSVILQASEAESSRTVVAQEFPISIDAHSFDALARQSEIQHRAQTIRTELGNPRTILLGVDRLDYTKGIRHRLKAYSELLSEAAVDPQETVLVQVASPSREHVSAYRHLRDEVELIVGRISGDHGRMGRSPLVYLHRTFSRNEMVALYCAADALVVTPLRDGMNLVAKEYVACRGNNTGVLLLSEFAGASDEFVESLIVNPHDIESLKSSIIRAVHMPIDEQERRMSAMRQTLFDHDVTHWAAKYLGMLTAYADEKSRSRSATENNSERASLDFEFVPRLLTEHIRRLATAPTLLVACDFDGTISPIARSPERARVLSRAQHALDVLSKAPGVHVAVLTGRSVKSLKATGLRTQGWVVSGSHGVELIGLDQLDTSFGPDLDLEESQRLSALNQRFERLFDAEPGVRVEAKPYGTAVHTREVRSSIRAAELLESVAALGKAGGFYVRQGKQVCECTLRTANKGTALDQIRDVYPGAVVLFLGDDITDEDAFAALRTEDLSIKVGDGATAAMTRVSNVETAAAVLAMLAELRTGTVIGSTTDASDAEHGSVGYTPGHE